MSENTVLRDNLLRVFNERDAARRRRAIDELYAPDAVFYEDEAAYSGIEAIANAVSALLASLPPKLVFKDVAPAQQNHAMSKLLWQGDLPDGSTVATGTDIAQLEAGRIKTLHVFLDPPK